jgi:hypothetical protein
MFEQWWDDNQHPYSPQIERTLENASGQGMSSPSAPGPPPRWLRRIVEWLRRIALPPTERPGCCSCRRRRRRSHVTAGPPAQPRRPAGGRCDRRDPAHGTRPGSPRCHLHWPRSRASVPRHRPADRRVLPALADAQPAIDPGKLAAGEPPAASTRSGSPSGCCSRRRTFPSSPAKSSWPVDGHRAARAARLTTIGGPRRSPATTHRGPSRRSSRSLSGRG